MPITTNGNYWILETAPTAYTMGVNDAGLLTHAYWGMRLPYMEDYLSGLVLMQHGIRVSLDNFQSTVRRIQKI